MPALTDPYRARPYVEPSDTTRERGPKRRAHTLPVRMRAALNRREITRALAEGVDPMTRDELSLRADQLTSTRTRATLARAMRRTIAEAHKPAMTRSRVLIIRRGAVLQAEDAITALIERLTDHEPVRAEGMAIAERILTNADRSPLYNDSEPGSLRRLITLATTALDPPPAQSHEFPFAA